MESRRTRRPTFTADERLERRREQDRRRHAERRARERREQTQARRMWMWIACGLPKPVPRSTKTTIMTVHVNPIMQAAPSQRRIISIIEASNQLLFHSQKLFFLEWIWWRINISLKSCSQSKKLQPGGKPNSFAFRNPGRPRRLINCSQDGSRTASRFAIQVNRDGRSNCSQLWSQQSPNKPCMPAPRRRQEKQRPDEKKISIRRLPQGTVRDLILLTMWVHSPTIVVIFVQCIDCSGRAFWLMGCCPQISHRFLPVYIINFTTGLQAYIHTFMIIFPNAVPHSLLSIIFNTACFHVT